MGDLSNMNNPTKSMSPWYFEVLANDPQNNAYEYTLFTVMYNLHIIKPSSQLCAWTYYVLLSFLAMNLLFNISFNWNNFFFVMDFQVIPNLSFYKNELFVPANILYWINVSLIYSYFNLVVIAKSVSRLKNLATKTQHKTLFSFSALVICSPKLVLLIHLCDVISWNLVEIISNNW